MKTLYFTCKLLSDIIVNQKSATEGNQQTLEFIPGAAFLGVAAGELYSQVSREESYLLFHSDKVQFGDAHIVVENSKSFPVPLSWYAPKHNDKKIYVHHGLPDDGLKENGAPVQLKQKRNLFVVKTDEKEVTIAEIPKQFAIKSAYDPKKRRSADEKMYGYQSLQTGTDWTFEVRLFDEAENFEKQITGALTGKKRIGRSSSSQYGLVEIMPIENGEKHAPSTGIETLEALKLRPENGQVESAVFVYAESRLIFADEYGQPGFEVKAEDFGLKGDIDWNFSQVRTFSYAPYNNKRKARDANRTGFEKGSVFCIRNATIDKTALEKMQKGVGLYLNEGFGRVLVNPDILEWEGNGESKFLFREVNANQKNAGNPVEKSNLETPADQLVLNYLQRQMEMHKLNKLIYKKSDDFIQYYERLFKGGDARFASQWGTIRQLATRAKTLTELKDDLFNTSDKNPGYLMHGVAKEKWDERGRRENLQQFINDLEEDNNFKNNDDAARAVIINLAAEMAKKTGGR